MDLHIIKLKNGEELLCKKYYTFTINNKDEYRLEVLTSSTRETNFDYLILKEEVESITTYSNCYLKDISGYNFMNMPENRIIEVFIKEEK